MLSMHYIQHSHPILYHETDLGKSQKGIPYYTTVDNMIFNIVSVPLCHEREIRWKKVEPVSEEIHNFGVFCFRFAPKGTIIQFALKVTIILLECFYLEIRRHLKWLVNLTKQI